LNRRPRIASPGHRRRNDVRLY